MISQDVIIGENEEIGKLKLTGFKSMEGEASIAVVRGKARMGYELTFKAEFTGLEGTYLDGLKCEVEIEELCDDSTDSAN